MADRELVIAGLGASTKFSSTDPAVRKANQDELRQYIQLADALEAPMVRTFGGNVEEGSTVDDAIDWVAENLAALADEAQRQGVTILLETHDAFCKGAQVAPALKQVDHPNVQAVWDVHHPYRMGESVEETWALIGPYVKHVHLKDAQTHDDGSFTLVLMGEGDVPNYEVVKLLLENGYDGYLAAEWEKKWHPTIEEPEIAIPQHAEVISRLVGGAGGRIGHREWGMGIRDWGLGYLQAPCCFPTGLNPPSLLLSNPLFSTLGTLKAKWSIQKHEQTTRPLSTT